MSVHGSSVTVPSVIGCVGSSAPLATVVSALEPVSGIVTTGMSFSSITLLQPATMSAASATTAIALTGGWYVRPGGG